MKALRLWCFVAVLVCFSTGRAWAWVEEPGETFYGVSAGASYQSGGANVLIGTSAGEYFNGGSYNTFVGDTAAGDPAGSSGWSNVFIGAGTGYSNTGNGNVFVGNSAGYSSGGGSWNVFIGTNAGHDENGSNKLIIANSGTDAPLIYGEFDSKFVRINGTLQTPQGVMFPDGRIQMKVLTGVQNANLTAYGIGAGDHNGSGSLNTFIGGDAGLANTSGLANTFVGYAAGTTNTQAKNNTFVGQASGWQHDSGNDNTFVGNGAGQYHVSGLNNTFVGSGAGTGGLNPNEHNIGDENTFIGYYAGHSNTGGLLNTFIGGIAGASNTTGRENVFVGNLAGRHNTIGSDNVFIGPSAGAANETGSGNIFIGQSAGFANQTGSNKLVIDNCYKYYFPDNCLPFISGDFASRTLQIDGSLTMVTLQASSDIRYKKDIQPLEASLEKVLHLRGVTYEWDQGKVKGAGYKSGTQIGLIAQEVEKVLPELVQTDSEGYKTLSYDKLVPVLVEAVKEQQGKISDLQKTIDEKDARIEKLERDNERIAEALEKLALQVAAIEGSAKSVVLQ